MDMKYIKHFGLAEISHSRTDANRNSTQTDTAIIIIVINICITPFHDCSVA
jgi:hypothetical protein